MTFMSDNPTSAGRPEFSHINERGEIRMVDVSDKPVTTREAVASARVTFTPAVLDALMSGRLPKGEALAAARIAGIQAAKRTAEWIPLCHPLPLTFVGVDFVRTAPNELSIECTVRADARTGAEMEALTAAAAAALTVYDMAKAADKGIVIGPIQLERKTGGRSGEFTRPPRSSQA